MNQLKLIYPPSGKNTVFIAALFVLLAFVNTASAGSFKIDKLISVRQADRLENINYGDLKELLTKEFDPLSSPVFHPGKISRPYWIKLNLSSLKDGLGESWILELATYKLNEIDIYYQDKTGELRHRKAGLKIPGQMQDSKGRNYVLLITGMDTSEPLLIRASAVYLRVPLHVWTIHDYFLKEQKQILLDGGFYGVLVAIVLYHLFIFIALRNRAYLNYAIFLSVVLLWYLAGRGWAFLFLFAGFPPQYSNLITILNPVLGGLLMITGIQFTRSYLKIADYSRGLDNALRANIWLLAALGAMGLVFIVSRDTDLVVYLYNFGFVVILLLIILCFSAAIKGFQQKQITARYYLVATSLQFFVSIYMILCMFEVLPFAFEWRVLQFCSVVEMLIFSYGLSRQVRQINEEKETITRELISTKEEMINQLETINNLKDKVLSKIMESRQYPEIARLFPVINSVTYIQAIGNYSRVVYLAEGMENEIEIQVGLKDIEKYFDQEHFIRIHKTYLVRQGIKFSLQRRSTADYDMVTRHFVLPVGRKYIKSIKEQLAE